MYTPGMRSRPFGYRRVEEGRAALEIDPVEAEIIRELAQRYLAGESLRSLARDLETRGVATVRGGLWTGSYVREILTNPFIAGMRRATDSGTLEPGPWRAVIDEATHHRLTAYAERQKSRGRQTRAGRRHLLTGIAVCGVCGGRMQGGPTTSGPRYVCANPTCRKVTIAMRPVDEVITNRIFTVIDRRDFGRRLGRAQGRPAALDEERRRLLERLDTLADMLAQGELDRTGYARARKNVQAQLEALRDRDREASATTPLDRWTRGGLREAWAGLTLDQRRGIITALVDRIVITPAKRMGHIFDPTRIVIPKDAWRV